jgi:hypothetical protein
MLGVGDIEIEDMIVGWQNMKYLEFLKSTMSLTLLVDAQADEVNYDPQMKFTDEVSR